VKFFTHYACTGYCNSYLVGPDGKGDAVLIDPGNFDAPLLNFIEENGFNLRYVLITHAHDGHINALETILKIYEPSLFYFGHSVLGHPTLQIKEGEDLELGEFTFKVLETPGHSGDSVVYKLNELLFTSDTLFAGSIGSTPDEFSKGLLLASLNEKILTLDDEHIIFPGHGPPSKIGIERHLNPDLLEEV